jgi:hypothetical protein
VVLMSAQAQTVPDIAQLLDFWQFALFAAIAYVRAATGRAGVPVRQVCLELPQRG